MLRMLARARAQSIASHNFSLEAELSQVQSAMVGCYRHTALLLCKTFRFVFTKVLSAPKPRARLHPIIVFRRRICFTVDLSAHPSLSLYLSRLPERAHFDYEILITLRPSPP